MDIRIDPVKAAEPPEAVQPLKIAVFIPNEGHTIPESYDNRLTGHLHLGILEGLSSAAEALRAAMLSPEQMASVSKRLAEIMPGNTAFLDLMLRKRPFQFFVGTAGRMHAHIAREVLADEALKLGADYLYMIDDDMLMPIDVFERLLAHDVDIVAPLAFMRKPPHHPVIYTVREGWDNAARQAYFQNFSVKTYPKDRLIECDAVGFGAVLIKTAVLRAIEKPWFATWSRVGEDIGFCHKAKKVGFKVYCDTSIKLGHLGDPIVVDEDCYERTNQTDELRKIYPDDDSVKLAQMRTDA